MSQKGKKQENRLLDSYIMRRLSLRLSDEELKRLPPSIKILQSSKRVSRTKILEETNIVPQKRVIFERKKLTLEEKSQIKRAKKEMKPVLGQSVKLSCI